MLHCPTVRHVQCCTGRSEVLDNALEFFGTEELVAEILRRKTFLGVIVHSAAELREGRWKGEKTFRVRFNSNLGTGEAGRLLDVIADHIDRQSCEEEG
jgi:hypothetical protein